MESKPPFGKQPSEVAGVVVPKKRAGPPWSRSPEAYQLDPEFHTLLTRYPVSFVARGGEHLVYEVPRLKFSGMRDIVIKGDLSAAKKLCNWFTRYGVQQPDQLPEAQREILRRIMEEDEQKMRELREAFGSKHVLRSRKSIEHVPVPKGVAQELSGPDTSRTECWTVVTVQTRAAELQDKEAGLLQVGADYLERDPDFKSEDFSEKADFYLEERSQALLEKAKEDKELRAVLIEFVTKAIQYTQSTGEILDLVGNNNVYLFKELQRDGSRAWSYRLIDAQHTGDKSRDYEQAGFALEFFQKTGSFMDGSDASTVANAMAYTRTINGLANMLAIEQRIPLLTDHPGVDRQKLFAELRKWRGMRNP